MKQNGILRWLALASVVMMTVFMSACSRGQATSRLQQAEIVTEETLLQTLLGTDSDPRGPIRDTRYVDKPLLEKGKYEHVLLFADTDAFIKLSRDSVSRSDIEMVQKNIITRLQKPFARRGFTLATSAPNSAGNTSDSSKGHTLKVTLSPKLQDAVNSPSKSSKSSFQKEKPALILVKMTITDAETGVVLTEREYYSGQDVKEIGEAKK